MNTPTIVADSITNKSDPRICPQCGRRFLSAKYRREHQRSAFAHLTPNEHLRYLTGKHQLDADRFS